jgi:hypothetical protein
VTKKQKEPDNKIVIPKEQIEGWNLYIAVPCYDNSVTEPFMMSLLKTMIHFTNIGMKCSVSTITDSLISRARNMLTAKFMADPQFTHLMFIDSDISFNYEALIKLLWHDKDVVAGAYPIKELNWEKISDLVRKDVPGKEAEKRSSRFAFSPIKPGQERVEISKGAISAYDLGTGFMMIKRETIEKLIEAHPELKYIDDTGSLTEKEKEYTYNFFNPYIDSDGRYLSEDYAFCRYVQESGGKTWLDPSIDLMHMGRYRYTGSASTYIDSIIKA